MTAALSYFGFESDGDSLPTGTADAVIRQMFPEPSPFLNDPTGWVESHGEFVISYQDEILRSLMKHRYTAAVACHGPGKTRIGSRAIGWWIDTWKQDAFVLWVAPKWAQVTSVMGRELRGMHQAFGLPGRLTLDQQWYIGDDILVGIGRSPADHDEAGLQGYHAKKILILVDEADGISPKLWKQIHSLMSSEDARCLMLGNPDDPTSEWCEECTEGNLYNVIYIPVDRTPNFTGEKVPPELAAILPSPSTVAEQIERYGAESPIIASKVHARWPKSHERSVYPADLVKACLVESAGDADAVLLARGKGSVLSVDVAREGKDRSIGLVLPPNGIPFIAFEFNQNDTTQLSGEIIAWYREHPMARIVVDANGVGAGVFDNCREAGLPVRAHYGSTAAKDKKAYLNARAERYFETQRAMQKGKLKIPKEMTRLRKQMAQMIFQYAGKGQLKIMSKEEMAEKNIASPDELDALTMGVYERGLGRLHLANVGMRETAVMVGGDYAV